MTELTNIINTTDRNGNSVTIQYTDQYSDIPGNLNSLELHIDVTKRLIQESLNMMGSVEKDGDFEVTEKVAALYLNEIGELYRHAHGNAEGWEGNTNLEIVSYILKNELSGKAVKEVIAKDNELKMKEKNEKV